MQTRLPRRVLRFLGFGVAASRKWSRARSGFRAQLSVARSSPAYQLEAVLLAQRDGARLDDTRSVATSRGMSWLAAPVRGLSRPC